MAPQIANEGNGSVHVARCFGVETDVGCAGFRKGQTRNGVGISDRHALALVNRDGTTRDLLALADEIQAAVAQTFGIGLEREPVLIEGD